MPEAEGAPRIERLASVRPSLRVLSVSGYAADTTVCQGALFEGATTPFDCAPVSI